MKKLFKICVFCFLCISSCLTIQAKENECIVQVQSDITTQFEFYNIEKFKKYPVNFENKDQLAYTLKSYVVKDNIKPDYVVMNISNSSMEQGTYLMVGKEVDSIFFTPSVIQINMNLKIEPKYEKIDTKTKNLMVEKKWNDGNGKNRPESIEIDLYANQEKVDTVQLSRRNGWTYTFNNLDASKDWLVVEHNVTKNYLVSCESNQDVVIITNTAKHVSEDSLLPNTGQLWWPVPILGVLGIAFLLMGRKHAK